MERFRWLLTAALSAYACHFAVQGTTPIDRALPFLALAVTLLAWVSYPEVMVGVPLLMVAEIALADETMRLLAIGAILAAAAGAALVGPAASRPCPRLPGGGALVASAARASGPRHGRPAAGPTTAAVVAIVVLRWIPIENVHVGRELFLLAIAIAIVFVLGRTPFAIAVAVITALVTPAVPLRTLALPLIVLIVAIAARTFGMPRVRLTWPSTVVVAFVMLFFAWSGIVARAFPYFLKPAKAVPTRLSIDALPPRHEVTLDVPHGARSLIVSGANVAHLQRGALLGRIEPGNIALTIGDAADWGYMRRDQFYGSHNPLPRDPAGAIRGYGYTAWVDGAGRVALPAGARRIRVVADAALPANAALQVEGFE